MMYVYDVVRIGSYHFITDNLHIACQYNKRNILLPQQLHFCSLYLCFVRMVLIYAPYIIGYAKLIGHITQILMVRYNARNFTIKLTGLPSCQHIIQAVTHLADENCHTRTLVAVVQAEFHLITLRIQCSYVIIYLVARNHKPFEFPFYTHEKHALYLINILIQINNVTLVISNKLCHLRDNTLLVGAM